VEPIEGGWCVYAALCIDGSLYIGVTTDLDRRIRQHNGEIKGGAKYTAARRPVTLVAYLGWFTRGADALRAESTIKRMSRKRKIAEITSRRWVQV
jgi:putative endonuclease